MLYQQFANIRMPFKHRVAGSSPARLTRNQQDRLLKTPSASLQPRIEPAPGADFVLTNSAQADSLPRDDFSSLGWRCVLGFRNHQEMAFYGTSG